MRGAERAVTAQARYFIIVIHGGSGHHVLRLRSESGLAGVQCPKRTRKL
jgi:hypothetical protein